MKKIFVILLFVTAVSFAQTNTFPDSGKVGIGTTNPQSELDIQKGAMTIGGPYKDFIFITQHWTNTSNSLFIAPKNNNDWDWSKQLIYKDTGDFIVNGKLGIGTSNPSSLLELKSSVKTELTVSGSSPDVINAGLVLKANDSKQNFRGLGTFMHDKVGKNEWFVGRPYWGSDRFVIYRRSNTTDHTQLSASTRHNSGSSITKELFTLDNEGKLGIGVSNPSHKLHIVGSGRTGLKIGGPSTSSGAISDLLFQPSNGGSIGEARYWDWSFRTDSWSKSPGDFVLYSNNGSTYTSPIIAQANGNLLLATGKGSGRNGNVSIGTTDPVAGYKLSVAGKIIAEGVKVQKQTNWPDYVFENEYQLPTLEEVENHIVQKGHLINIPSAAEVAENGIQLGEMNAKLLEKIEELTLYTIAQEKKLTNQESRNQKLEMAIEQQRTINQLLETRLTKIEALLK